MRGWALMRAVLGETHRKAPGAPQRWDMDRGILYAGLALALALLVWLHRKLDRLPPAIWSVAKKERGASETKALDLMKETVAQKAGQALIAIMTYHERVVAGLHDQIASTETRARVGERRASEAAAALSTATNELRALLDTETILFRERRASLDTVPELIGELSTLATLVRELRALRASAPDPRMRAFLPPSTPSPVEPEATEPEGEDAAQRKTLETTGAPTVELDDWSADEETKVADRPADLAALLKARPTSRADQRNEREAS